MERLFWISSKMDKIGAVILGIGLGVIIVMIMIRLGY